MKRLVFVLAFALGCGRVRTPADEAVVLLPSGFSSLDPRFVTRLNDVLVGKLALAGLSSGDTPDGAPVPELAQSIQREGPGRYLVTLRPDARFSDGTPLEAQDVVYTMRSLLDPITHATVRAWWAQKGYTARGVEALDAHRVRFTLAAPLATFETDLEIGIVSARTHGELVGAGPFRIVHFDPDRVDLEPNPYWPLERPRLRRVTFKVVRDAGASLLALAGGSADLLQDVVSPLLLDRVAENPALRVRRGPSMGWLELGMNCADPLLGDVRVRRAIAMAIDRRAIVDAKYHGRAVVANSILNPADWAHSAQARLPACDPDAARRLLGEAGAVGAHLTLKTDTDPMQVALARVLTAQLRAVGLDVELRVYELGTLIADADNGNVQLYLFRHVHEGEPDVFYTRFHSSNIPVRGETGRRNYARWKDPETDALTELARRTEDRAERRRLYARVQQRLAEMVPVLPLWHPDTVAIVRRELEGYEPLPNLHFCRLVGARKLSGR